MNEKKNILYKAHSTHKFDGEFRFKQDVASLEEIRLDVGLIDICYMISYTLNLHLTKANYAAFNVLDVDCED